MSLDNLKTSSSLAGSTVFTNVDLTGVHDHLAQVVYWIDGDTVKVMIDEDFRDFTEESVRLTGIDTPERGDEPGYSKAKARATELAPPGSIVLLKSKKAPPRSFARYVATVYALSGDGRSIDQILTEEGHIKGRTWD